MEKLTLLHKFFQNDDVKSWVFKALQNYKNQIFQIQREPIFFFKIFIWERVSERERERKDEQGEGEGEADLPPLSREPDVGLDPRTLGP